MTFPALVRFGTIPVRRLREAARRRALLLVVLGALVVALPPLAPAQQGDPERPRARGGTALRPGGGDRDTRPIDLDGDGLISEKEFAQSRIGQRRPEAFGWLDTNGDGFLDEAELVQGRRAMREGRTFPGMPPEQELDRIVEAAIAHAAQLVHRDLAYTGAAAAGTTSRGEQPAGLAAAGDPLQRLDLYIPRGVGPFPVVVYLHGGGWARGDKSASFPLARFFTEAGYAFASVNYRLSPAVTHPEHVRDVAAALAWLAERVGDYGGDPARMVVMGHSAGAHLAALVATDARRLAGAGAGTPAETLRGVILLDGAGYDVPRQIEHGSPAALAGIYVEAFTDDPATQRDASPIAHVTADGTYAPFLIFHVARRDDAREQSTALADALRAASGTAEVVSVADRTHATIVTQFGRAGDPVAARVLEFLAEVVGRGALPPAGAGGAAVATEAGTDEAATAPPASADPDARPRVRSGGARR